MNAELWASRNQTEDHDPDVGFIELWSKKPRKNRYGAWSGGRSTYMGCVEARIVGNPVDPGKCVKIDGVSLSHYRVGRRLLQGAGNKGTRE